MNLDADAGWVHLHKASERNPFFGEVTYRTGDDGLREVKLIVKPGAELGFELGCAALAVDGSKSMMPSYAAHLPPMLRKAKNAIEPMVKSLALYLADNAQGKLGVAYWACGDDGGDVEPVGIMAKSDLESYTFGGPKAWGGGTKLSPLVRYFWQQIFSTAAGPGIAVVVTDGAWDDDDHEQLKVLSREISAEIAAGRPLMKCVLLGLRLDSNAGELERIQGRFSALDELNTGDVDLWDHKWLDEMEDMSEMFIELVQDWSLGVGGYVEAGGSRVLERNELKFGMYFKMPASADSFTLHLNDVGDFTQTLI